MGFSAAGRRVARGRQLAAVDGLDAGGKPGLEGRCGWAGGTGRRGEALHMAAHGWTWPCRAAACLPVPD